MSKRTAVLTKEGKKYVLFLLENENPSKHITIQSEEEEIADFTLKNRLGFPIEKATYSMVAKGSVLLPKASIGESEGYEVTESEFDTANDGRPSDETPQPGGAAKRRKLLNDVTPISGQEFCCPEELNILPTIPPATDRRGRAWEFLAAPNWLESISSELLAHAELLETNDTTAGPQSRVSPIALIRCSRGGKTRSLYEIAKKVRALDSTYSILFVSFNTDTPLRAEPRDALSELCVRIAFAAYKMREKSVLKFNEFYYAHQVTKEWVLAWLKDSKCILFVDELNLLQNKIDSSLAGFLRDNFLMPRGRGFIFSSHIASVKNRLAEFVSSPSNREVLLRPLPVIPSLQKARDNFDYQDLSAQQALFLGLIPGLIAEQKNNNPITDRRALVTEFYIDALASMPADRAVNEVRTMLKSVLTGRLTGASQMFLQELMTADLNQLNDEMILRWIPFHMVEVLAKLSTAFLPRWICDCLSSLVTLFEQFQGSKWESGDAWEALFLIITIIRCLTGSFDDVVLPLRPGTHDVKVAFNSPWVRGEISGLATIRDPLEFIECIPLRKPAGSACHISVYYPTHAKFETYDVIVAFWNLEGERLLYGYQLKEGSAIPTGYAFSSVFDQSYLIRGDPKEKSTSLRLWRSVKAADLDSFFGVSAAQWSPRAWRELEGAKT